MANNSIDDGESIIYDQIISVESIYGIGFGVEEVCEAVISLSSIACFHHTKYACISYIPPSIKASIY